MVEPFVEEDTRVYPSIFDDPNKTPRAALNELADHLGTNISMNFLGKRKQTPNEIFTFAATLGGRQFPQASGFSKKDAKQKAASIAIEILKLEGFLDTPLSTANGPRYRMFKIFNARIPILKFRPIFLHLYCDISFELEESSRMTEILYLVSIADPRIKPLFTGIKEWAKVKSLTSGGESTKITTLGLLHLMVFFLQRVQPPVLPPLRYIKDSLETSSYLHAYERDEGSRNTLSIESLLHGFFSLFSTFDFSRMGISTFEGSTFIKHTQPCRGKLNHLYIQNPVNPFYNLCFNVNQEFLMNFQLAMTDTISRMRNLSDVKKEDHIPYLSVLFGEEESSSSHPHTHGHIDTYTLHHEKEEISFEKYVKTQPRL